MGQGIEAFNALMSRMQKGFYQTWDSLMAKGLGVCYQCCRIMELKYFSFRNDTNRYRLKCRRCAKGTKNLREENQIIVEDRIRRMVSVCGKCREELPFSAYNKDSNTKSGVGSYCRVCVKKISDAIPKIKKTIQRYMRVYGVTKAKAKELARVTHCEICGVQLNNGRKLDSRHIDHCHETGKVRGVLCASCNLGLGHFKDNTDTMKKGTKYLSEKI